MLESFRKGIEGAGTSTAAAAARSVRWRRSSGKKPVAAEKPLWTAGGPYAPRHDGISGMSLPRRAETAPALRG